MAKGGYPVEDARKLLLEALDRAIADKRVIEAMTRVPREFFVPEEYRHMAYEDSPLPIGYGQTISQPYMVAIMLQALEVRRTDRVLEVGTGSGYQASLLAELAGEVITVERVPALAETARATLARLGYSSVRVEPAGEIVGRSEDAPYDCIVVAAGAPKLMRGLMDQLAVGGRLVMPVGSSKSQELMKVTRSREAYSVVGLGECRFVPLIGKDAWPDEGSAQES
ncbi:MAG: protein-L-isoaspartate(D-aspartate) O-methyltransferase [SAR202 cluster bacterium]|nr:protein-L-isoaspartate(D-aspartate) O-methyltransferase [SAR202 cluster bacterium]